MPAIENSGEEIFVCLSCDERFSPYLGIAIHSILSSAQPKDKLQFFVLDDHISAQRKKEIFLLQDIHPFRITYIDANMSIFDKAEVSCFLSRACYGRLLMGRLLPKKVHRVIYMDCDVLVRESLSGLWHTDLRGRTIGGVVDLGVMREARTGQHPWPWKDAYINSGVLLVDLKRWRSIGAEQKLLGYLEFPRWPLKCHDQDVINFALHEEITAIPSRWNAQIFWSFLEWDNEKGIEEYRRILDDAALLHYATSNKPWLRFGGRSVYRTLYRAYMAKTPWKRCIMSWEGMSTILGNMAVYWRRHPVCFLQPSFYRKLYQKGVAVFR